MPSKKKKAPGALQYVITTRKRGGANDGKIAVYCAGATANAGRHCKPESTHGLFCYGIRRAHHSPPNEPTASRLYKTRSEAQAAAGEFGANSERLKIMTALNAHRLCEAQRDGVAIPDDGFVRLSSRKLPPPAFYIAKGAPAIRPSVLPPPAYCGRR